MDSGASAGVEREIDLKHFTGKDAEDAEDFEAHSFILEQRQGQRLEFACTQAAG